MSKIVIDTFFHMMPGHRLSRNISVGGYITNFGRYTPYDLYHPNGSSMLYSDLVADYDVQLSNQPFSEVTLCGTDLLIIPNPDYPMYEGASPYRMDHYDVDALMNYLKRGGKVVMLVNSFLRHSDFWEENFDYERVDPFFEKLGLKWDPDYMSDDNEILPAKSGDFIVGYGQGGRVLNNELPDGAQALIRWDKEINGFVKKVGKGTIAVIGDAGVVSNGLYGFPTFDNRGFILDLIHTLLPKETAAPAKFEKMTYSHLSTAPSEDGIPEKLFMGLNTDAEYKRDHHYRHLVWETAGEEIDASDVELPFDLKELEGAEEITVELPLVAVKPGVAVKTLPFKLHVVATKKLGSTEYLITGTTFTEGLDWADIGAPAEDFGKNAKLLRVNTVVQYQLEVKDGKLCWAALKQGQIFYARSENIHYGYNILLGSRNVVYSPIRD